MPQLDVEHLLQVLFPGSPVTPAGGHPAHRRRSLAGISWRASARTTLSQRESVLHGFMPWKTCSKAPTGVAASWGSRLLDIPHLLPGPARMSQGSARRPAGGPRGSVGGAAVLRELRPTSRPVPTPAPLPQPQRAPAARPSGRTTGSTTTIDAPIDIPLPPHRTDRALAHHFCRSSAPAARVMATWQGSVAVQCLSPGRRTGRLGAVPA